MAISSVFVPISVEFCLSLMEKRLVVMTFAPPCWSSISVEDRLFAVGTTIAGSLFLSDFMIRVSFFRTSMVAV